jgi:hypothetical protein
VVCVPIVETGGNFTTAFGSLALAEELDEEDAAPVDWLVAEVAALAACAWWADQATAPTPTDPATARPAVRVDSARVPDLRAAAPCARRWRSMRFTVPPVYRRDGVVRPHALTFASVSVRFM